MPLANVPPRISTTKTRLLLCIAVCLCIYPTGYLRGQGAIKQNTNSLAPGEFTSELNGLKLWYKVSGTGPVCLMPTPAWGPSSDLWFRTLKPLEKIFTVVYLDSRGTGRSQHAKSTKDYTWNDLVADLDALRAHLKQEKVWLMGHSEGGVQILHYVFKHSERVSGLVLLSAPAVSDEKFLGEWQTRALRRKDQPWFAEAMQALKTDYTSDDQLKAGFAKMLPLYWSDPRKIDNYQADFAATSWSADAFHGARDSNHSQYDLTEQLKRVKAPALIVVGDGDFICWPENTKRLHLSLAKSKLLVIENAGHFPWLEQPEAFFRDVPIFLQALNLTSNP